MIDVKRDVLFVGLGATAVAYYRCMLPAMTLGSDWVGVVGDPEKGLGFCTGLVKDEKGYPLSQMPDFSRYKIVVLQQPASSGWRNLIDKLHGNGQRVIYEIDDYVHGIPAMDDHDWSPKARKKRGESEAGAFDKKHLWEIEQTMKRSDALIASTEWIRGNYSHFAKRTFVCRNGIDLKRYELTKPKRPCVNVGWAGATGHLKAVIPWFQQLAAIMRMRENVNFVSIGQDFARGFQQHFPEERAISVPWAAIEQYPAAMTMLDLALAPGGGGGWWRGKSDLRWLEAGALGIPIIADPVIYPDIEDGVDGFHAVSPEEAAEKMLALVDNVKLRTVIGENARTHVRQKRDIKVMAKQWIDVLNEVDEQPPFAELHRQKKRK